MGSLEVWCGPAGSGKSARVAEDIARESAADPLGPPLFWVVPAEATYWTEQTLLRRLPAVLRAEVLTFDRFWERLWQQAGWSPNLAVNRTGRRLILAAVYEERRDQLRAMKRTELSVRLLDALLGAFRTFSRAGVASGEPPWHPELAEWPDKLRDLAVLYDGYREALRTRGLADPDLWLADRLSDLRAGQLLNDATVYFDGFADFDPLEQALLLAVAESARRTVLTLSADPAWLRAASPGRRPGDALGDVYAAQTLVLFEELRQACIRRGLRVDIHWIDRPLRFQTPDLRRLRQLWHPAETQAGAPAGAAGRAGLGADVEGQPGAEGAGSRHLCFAYAPSLRAEVDGIAREVVRLVREEGLSWRDVAVVAPRLEVYAPYVRDSFAKHGVPCHVDLPQPLAHHPLGRLLLSALDVSETGWSLEASVRLCKCELTGLAAEDADWLEQYIRRYEVAGTGVWQTQQPWTFAWDQRSPDADEARLQADDQRADRLRQVVARRVLPFVGAVAADALLPAAFARAIWELLESTGARRALAAWIAGEGPAQAASAANLHEQAWLKVTSVLDDLAESGCDRPLPRRYLFALVRRALTEEALATVPAGSNQVLITDAARAEAFEADAVFVPGAADGVLPPRVRDSGVLGEDEVAWLREALGVRVGRSRSEREAEGWRRLYQAVTRARRWLYVSCPLADAEGRAVHPSRWLDEVRRLFSGDSHDGVRQLWWERSDLVPDGPPAALEPQLEWVAARLRQAVHWAEPAMLAEPGFAAAVAALAADPQARAWLRRVVAGAQHVPAAGAIGPGLARRLYGERPAVSVSQLETFAACPFRHFVAYGLRIREEEPAEPTAAVRGTLVHEVVREFVRRMAADTSRWRALSEAEAEEAMRSALEAVLERPDFAHWTRRAARRQRVQAVWPLLATAARVLTEHARHGLFEPVALELAFGEGEALPALEVELPGGGVLRLRGRIDRVDRVAVGRWFRVIDYKSSRLNLDFTRVEHGLQLQLPVYAAVVERHGELLFGYRAQPAALLYVPLVRRLEVCNAPEDAMTAIAEADRALQARGVLASHPEVIAATDQRLLSGTATNVFRQVYRKDGTLAATAPVLNEAQWRALLGRAIARAAELGARMAAGDIAVAPYRLGRAESACRYCPYPGLCHLEPRRHAAWERKLERFAAGDLWMRWAAAAAHPDGGSGGNASSQTDAGRAEVAP
ncbi:MAG: PD-(D/E)XK nuclease family protein [Alicyclobacillaceae bacterium]|nr:PD-(D/E)XK nuclease family protein [Alicyclobacillaceae bacterium]